MIIETFRQAIQNVWSNKLRTFLTMLGIIIGVMAVIVIVGLGNGMTKSMRDSFSALGTNTLSVQVWGNGSRTVSVEEMYKLPTEYPELIQSISPQIDFSGSGTLKIGTTSYRWSNISGVDENYSAMKNYQIAQGRGLQYMDMKDNKHVATALARRSRSVPTSSASWACWRPKSAIRTCSRAAMTTAFTCPIPRPCAFPARAR